MCIKSYTRQLSVVKGKTLSLQDKVKSNIDGLYIQIKSRNTILDDLERSPKCITRLKVEKILKKTEKIAVSFSTTASILIFLYCITLSVSCLSLHLTFGSSFPCLDCCHVFCNLGTFCFKLCISTLLSQILLWLNKNKQCFENVKARLQEQEEEANSLHSMNQLLWSWVMVLKESCSVAPKDEGLSVKIVFEICNIIQSVMQQ